MKFKEFLKSKNISEDQFNEMSADEVAKLQQDFYNEQFKNIATQKDLLNLKEEIKKMPNSEQVKELSDKLDDVLAKQKEQQGFFNTETIEQQVHKFIDDNKDKIKEIHEKQSGVITLEVNKTVGTITTTNAQNVDPTGLSGVQQAPPAKANLRENAILNLETSFKTNSASFPYTETVPKDGDYGFVAECEKKPQIDFETQTRYATPKKIAAWMELSDESVQDIPMLQSIATDLLFKKHNIKKAKGILNGSGTNKEPKGATKYGRKFNLTKLKASVEDPTFMDVVNSVVTDIATTHNYEDEIPYVANVVMVNPIDFFKEVVSKKREFDLSDCDIRQKTLYFYRGFFIQERISS